MAKIIEGRRAPDFALPDAAGRPVSLADFQGQDVVVYFYPKDDTPGCTKEACGFRDLWKDLRRAGVAVLGWGQFITVVINFLILAFIIFLLVRWANKLMRKGPDAAGPTEVELLTEIRDELRKR